MPPPSTKAVLLVIEVSVTVSGPVEAMPPPLAPPFPLITVPVTVRESAEAMAPPVPIAELNKQNELVTIPTPPPVRQSATPCVPAKLLVNVDWFTTNPIRQIAPHAH